MDLNGSIDSKSLKVIMLGPSPFMGLECMVEGGPAPKLNPLPSQNDALISQSTPNAKNDINIELKAQARWKR